MAAISRLRIDLRGAVQGVGFRPFVYRLAQELGLAGWVRNDSRGVTLEIEGPALSVEELARRLPGEIPPRAALHSFVRTELQPTGEVDFRIRESPPDGPRRAVVLPDATTCPDCLAEVQDPDDRRYRYPFTNCTNCGPRFSIIESLPYDRPRTTMKRFEMCPACSSEYQAPLDRRFHAQPNACPDCGPQLRLLDATGQGLAIGHEALVLTARALAGGGIVAIQGLGGFHLMVDATDPDAVECLRHRKRRPDKPLAILARDLAAVREIARTTPELEQLLAGPEGPIVLLPALAGSNLAPALAPGLNEIGVFLPPTPLHHLLMQAVDRPLVATSGNRASEPICIDRGEALDRLAGIADHFLVHDRPIARPVDDSVVRPLAGRPRIIRRARGWAPMPVRLVRPVPTLLAVGAHLKCVIGLAVGQDVFLSQHLGDMETPEAQANFERIVADFLDLYRAEPEALAHDLHPGYPSTRWALDRVPPGLQELPRIGVQHHHAHLAATLAEHGLERHPSLGLLWDGTGLGTDGTIWGGEALVGDAASFERVAHLRTFPLPGGDAAVREPRRCGLALLRTLQPDRPLPRTIAEAFTHQESSALARWMDSAGTHLLRTSSMGRLFDGVAAILGLRERSSYEGQAAMELEALVDPTAEGAYPLPLLERSIHGTDRAPAVLDWGPMIDAILRERGRGTDAGTIAARFHRGLADAALEIARRADRERVVLSGGCFQNRVLTELCSARLTAAGFRVLLGHSVPANDGGIALGQVVVAAAQLEKGS